MPTWLLYTIGVLVFAFGLLASIALHEIGHMVPAKKFGVKVTQYMVGFGPTVWSRKKGDTEYGLKAVPLGGYIRMIGMIPPGREGARSRWPRRMATAIEDFRQVSRQEVTDPADEPRQFYRLTPGKKMIIMVGGPFMNLVIYLVLTVVVLLAIGTPKADPSATIASVVKCVVPASSSEVNATTCPKDAKTAPALGKLEPDDRVVAVDGTAVSTWDQFVTRVQASPDKALSLVVLRDGKRVPVTVTPTLNRNYVSGTTRIASVGYLGIDRTAKVLYEDRGITALPGQIGSQIKLGLDTLGRYPSKIKSLWQTVFDGKQRDPQGAVGVVGISRISGDYASSHTFSVRDKLFTLLSLLASVNLLLFFFNLLPILPLDGGHVAGAIVESVKRGRARLRARGRPAEIGPDGVAVHPSRQIFVDTAQMLPVMYAVASVFLLLTLLTLYADIVKPINVG